MTQGNARKMPSFTDANAFWYAANKEILLLKKADAYTSKEGSGIRRKKADERAKKALVLDG